MGLVGSGIAGAIVDKFKCYKWAMLVSFVSATIALSLFGIALKEDQFWKLFVLSGGIGFTMMPILPLCLETSVEITYPLREGTPSGLLMNAGMIFGIIMIISMGYIIDTADNVAWSVVIVVVAVGFSSLLILLFRGKLKRSEQSDTNKNIQ
jgi:MFS family permease